VAAIFENGKVDRLTSDHLVQELLKIEERPWAEWRRGHPLTKTSLARLLRPFGIKPKQMKKSKADGGGGAKGYERAPILEARKRYCEAKVADEEDVPETEEVF
jgi:hypothetical protein